MNRFDIKAMERVRQFYRRPGSVFYTGKGKENRLLAITGKAVLFCTGHGRMNRISRSGLTQAISRLLMKRSLTRKQLERFSNFNSALLGLISLVFGDEIKVHETATGSLLITLKGTRFIFSGVDRSKQDIRIAAENGAEIGMISYFHVRDDKTLRWKAYLQEHGMFGFLDSGAFSLWEALKEGKVAEPIVLADLVAFIKEHQDILVGYSVLDVIGDPAATLENYFEIKAAGLEPVPIWHINPEIKSVDGQDWEGLSRWIKNGHPLLGIGGSANMNDTYRLPIYQEILRRYPDQNFHIFGCGSAKVLFKLKGLFQSDASSWRRGRTGRIITPDGQKKTPAWMPPLESLARSIRTYCSLLAN